MSACFSGNMEIHNCTMHYSKSIYHEDGGFRRRSQHNGIRKLCVPRTKHSLPRCLPFLWLCLFVLFSLTAVSHWKACMRSLCTRATRTLKARYVAVAVHLLITTACFAAKVPLSRYGLDISPASPEKDEASVSSAGLLPSFLHGEPEHQEVGRATFATNDDKGSCSTSYRHPVALCPCILEITGSDLKYN